MKNENKVFVSVPITQEIIEKMDEAKAFFCMEKYNYQAGFFQSIRTGGFIKNNPSRFVSILLQQPIPIGKTEEEINIHEKVYTALGAASMCWKPQPSSQVFQSYDAQEIGDKLISDILEYVKQEIASSQLQPSQVGGTESGCGCLTGKTAEKFLYNIENPKPVSEEERVRMEANYKEFQRIMVKSQQSLSPIVLPSEQEITKQAEKSCRSFSGVAKFNYEQGAKWMRDKWLASHKGEQTK